MSVFANVGINQIVLCKRGTLATLEPPNIIAVGLRKPAELTFEPLHTTTDYRERETRNFLNANVKAETLQPTLQMIKDIVDAGIPDGGMDCEVLAVPQTTGVSGGCFQFRDDGVTTPEQYIGVDFEWKVTKEMRSIEFDCNVALPYTQMKSLIDAADSNTPGTFGLTNYGNDFTKQRSVDIEISDATFNGDELLDFSFSMKNVGDKSVYNRTKTNFFAFQVEFTFRSATIANIVTALERNISPSLTFKVNQGAFFDRVIFNAGALALKTTPLIADKSRTVKLTYSGQVPWVNLAFSNGTTDGGNQTDYTDGGTITVSA